MAIERALEWYRADQHGEMVRVWLRATAILVGGGSLMLLVLLDVVHDPRATLLLAIVAVLCIAAGPLSAIVGLLRTMRGESFVALSRGGIEICRASLTDSLAWDDLLRVDSNVDGVQLTRLDGSQLAIERSLFSIEPATLARRINHMRCKVQLQLLR